MIYHVFKGNMDYHVLPMMDCIINHSEHRHFFLVYFEGYSLSLLKKYFAFFKRKNHAHFRLILLPRSPRYVRVPKLDTFLKKVFPPAGFGLLRKLLPFRKEHLLFHSTHELLPQVHFCYFPAGFRSISFVNWETPRLSHNAVLHWLKKASFRRSRLIVSCMTTDKEASERISGKDNGVNAYYWLSELPAACRNVGPARPVCDKILLGNNRYALENYITALRRFRSLDQDVQFTCMTTYGAEPPDEKKAEFQALLDEYGERVSLWDEMLPLEAYFERVLQYDVIVLLREGNAGLSLVLNGLGMGKKLFLTGLLLEEMRKSGFHVFDFFSAADKDFTHPLDEEERMHNIRLFRRLTSLETYIEKWEGFYRRMEQTN